MSCHKKPKTINPDEVDPSVYYYDEVYDDMKDEEEKLATKGEDDKPKQQGSKYIQGILETADRRKSEKEIRKFKRFARDREEAEANGELDQSDVYITKAYEKKLKEVQDNLKKSSNINDKQTFNSFKVHQRQNSDKASTTEFQPYGQVAGTSDTKEPTTQTNTPTSEANQSTIDRVGAAETSRPVPKTIEDRRKYLREVLAKRTVGDVLRAAQERYKLRKTSAETLY